MIEQLEIIVFEESEEGHLGMILRIWRKKYPEVKSRGRLSVKLLCDVCIRLRDLNHYLD